MSIILPRPRSNLRPTDTPRLNLYSRQAEGLVGWFPFSDGSNRAFNYAPPFQGPQTQLPRELQNTSVTASVNQLGHCRDFGTSTDDFYYYSPGDITDLSFPVTYSAWIVLAENVNGLICGQSRDTSSVMFSWLTVRDSSGMKGAIVHRNTTFYATPGTTTLQLGVPYLITGVIRSATHREIYTNGRLENIGTDSSNAFGTADRNFSIGMARDFSPGDTFAGTIAHVCVWNEAKSTEFVFNELWLKPWDLYLRPRLMVPGFVLTEEATETTIITATTTHIVKRYRLVA